MPAPVMNLTPPLKWAGGKRWQVPFIRTLWEPNRKRRLVEPFCGGLAIALGLRPERALLNDANPHLINFYRWLQRGLAIDLKLTNREDLYYCHRNRFNALVAEGLGGCLGFTQGARDPGQLRELEEGAPQSQANVDRLGKWPRPRGQVPERVERLLEGRDGLPVRRAVEGSHPGLPRVADGRRPPLPT